jgi:hypothetical protein
LGWCLGRLGGFGGETKTTGGPFLDRSSIDFATIQGIVLIFRKVF